MYVAHAARRTIAAALLGVLAYLAGKHNWLDHDYGSVLKIVSLVALIAVLVLMLWLVIHHSSVGTVLAFVIGLAAFWFCQHEFEFKTAVHVVVLVVVAFGLWLAIVPDGSLFKAFFYKSPKKPSKA